MKTVQVRLGLPLQPKEVQELFEVALQPPLKIAAIGARHQLGRHLSGTGQEIETRINFPYWRLAGPQGGEEWWLKTLLKQPSGTVYRVQPEEDFPHRRAALGLGNPADWDVYIVYGAPDAKLKTSFQIGKGGRLVDENLPLALEALKVAPWEDPRSFRPVRTKPGAKPVQRVEASEGDERRIEFVQAVRLYGAPEW